MWLGEATVSTVYIVVELLNATYIIVILKYLR